MESVTDCWLCRLVIDLSGERCFSQAATVLWKPQERARGRGEEIKIKRWRCTWTKKKKDSISLKGGSVICIGGGARLTVIIGIILGDLCHPLQISDLAVGIQCCSVACYDLWISDQRVKRRDEYKLACCDRLGSAGRAFCGQREEHPFCANGSRYCWSGNWALIKPHVCSHLFIIAFIPLPQLLLSHTHTHSSLFSTESLYKKKKKQLL